MLSSVEKLIGGQLHSDAALINESVRTYIKRFIMRCCGMEILPGITLECVKKSRQFVSGDRNYYIRMPFTENPDCSAPRRDKRVFLCRAGGNR